MSNMREIKLRIKSINETRQITKAMKLMSAAKLRKAKQQYDATMPYINKIRDVLVDIVLHTAIIDSKYFEDRKNKPNKKVGYLVLTGDKSMAGGYNSNILKMAEIEIRKAENPVIYNAGYIGREHFRKKGYNMKPEFFFPVQDPTIRRAKKITDQLLKEFLSGELDEVYLIHTRLETVLKMEPTVVKLLPLDVETIKHDLQISEESARKSDESLTYEPSPSKVFDVLFAKNTKGIIYGAFVQSYTCELSARMTAMDSATVNADEMLQSLNLFYNRARQASITQEISEIVGGAAALKS